MIQNLCCGRIYKGSNTEITVPVFPCCFDGEVQDMLVSFYTVEDGPSINFSQAEGMEIVDGKVTVMLTALALDNLEDGQLKYYVECSAFEQAFESRLFIKTPEHQAPETDYITRGDAQEMIDESIAGKQDTLISGETIKTVNYESILGSGNIEIKGGGVPYNSLTKIEDHTYKIEYGYLDYTYAYNYFETTAPVNVGGCTTVWNGQEFGRNFDWHYSNQVDFEVHTDNVVGFANVTGLDVETVETDKLNEKFKILPFCLTDGMNYRTGMFAAINVVNHEGRTSTFTTPRVEEKERVSALMLVRFILDKFDTVDEALEYIQDYVTIYFPTALQDMGYEAHWMIGQEDDPQAKVLEIVENTIYIHDSNVNSNFYLTGFTPNEDGTAYSIYDVPTHTPSVDNGLRPMASGVERFNIAVRGLADELPMRTIMDQLKYTKAYTMPRGASFWYSEFVGNEFTIDNAPSDFTDVINATVAEYESRTRENPVTWQSVHSVVYDTFDKSVDVKAQEYYEYDIYAPDYYTKDEVDEIVAEAMSDVAEDIPTNVSELTNDSKYIKSSAPTDIWDIWTGTEAQYNAILKNIHTIYLIRE